MTTKIIETVPYRVCADLNSDSFWPATKKIHNWQMTGRYKFKKDTMFVEIFCARQKFHKGKMPLWHILFILPILMSYSYYKAEKSISWVSEKDINFVDTYEEVFFDCNCIG